MLKQYELLDIIEGLVDDFKSDEWTEFLQVDSKKLSSDKLIVNFSEFCEEYGFRDNKYLIEIKPVYKKDEHYDEVLTWDE
jgi:hypothetical protein